MTNYKTKRIIDGKPPLRTVIVDEDGKIVNRNPTKDELKGLETEILPAYTRGNKKIKIIKSCCICGTYDTYIDPRGYEVWFLHKCQKATCTGYQCAKCYDKYDPNSKSSILRSVSNRRTGNIDPNSTSTKGDRGEDLLCEWKKFKNLNKENDNYSSGTRIDCQDPITGLYYQVKCTYFNGDWHQIFYSLHNSIQEGFRFKTLFIFCISKNGNTVERIYEIPEDVVIKTNTFRVIKHSYNKWEKYRFTDEKIIKKIDRIWKKIIENGK